MLRKKLVNLAGMLLTSAAIVLPSSNGLSQESSQSESTQQSNNESKEERIYKLNLQYESSAVIVDSQRANDLEESFKKSFYNNFSSRKTIKLETFEEARKKYNDKINTLARRGIEYGARDFLRSSEPGIYFERKFEDIKEKLNNLGSFKIPFSGGKSSGVEFDTGIELKIPHTYAYVGASFGYNGIKEVARAELRALPSELDFRLKTQTFDNWNFIIGAKTKYGLNGEDDKFFYSRLNKKNNSDYYLFNDDDERYTGIEFQAGRINGIDDLQAL